MAFYLSLGKSVLAAVLRFCPGSREGVCMLQGLLVIGILRQGYAFGFLLSVGILWAYYFESFWELGLLVFRIFAAPFVSVSLFFPRVFCVLQFSLRINLPFQKKKRQNVNNLF